VASSEALHEDVNFTVGRDDDNEANLDHYRCETRLVRDVVAWSLRE